jgi:predicted RND superfamily exporter protein
MPMFSAFGILTAMMIVLSFLMALFALPGLLLLFTRSD